MGGPIVVSADQIRGNGRKRYAAPLDATRPLYSKNNRKGAAQYQCRATQLTPAWHLATPIMAMDQEGCQRNGKHYSGSLSIVNQYGQTVYDVYVNHGGEWGEDGKYQTFINSLPPKRLGFAVAWEDLKPRNGAQPVEDVMRNVAQLFEDRTIVMHDAGADMRLLNASSEVAGVRIAWEKVQIRDTQKFDGWFQYALGAQGPSLKICAAQVMGDFDFQSTSHRSLEDAEMTMRLYLKEAEAIEAQYAGCVPITASPVAATVAEELEADEAVDTLTAMIEAVAFNRLHSAARSSRSNRPTSRTIATTASAENTTAVQTTAPPKMSWAQIAKSGR